VPVSPAALQLTYLALLGIQRLRIAGHQRLDRDERRPDR
jgi:hypothetical protein